MTGEKREFKTPAGTHDTLFQQCAGHRRVEAALRSCFAGRGYSEAATPILEYMGVFETADGRGMYKLVDTGDILVVRPDSTAPIARLVASKLSQSPLPLRVYYDQAVCRPSSGNHGARAQITQCGIELIGARGLRADVEIAETAVAALAASGLDEFAIELGHAGIYQSLARAIDFTEPDAEQVRRLTETKNYAALNDLLADYEGRYPDECGAMRLLPRLFGGAEVLDEADKVVKVPEAAEAIKYLRQIYTAIDELGFADKVCLDLGLVNYMDYYTGVILSGYVSGSGEQVLSGGRYDSMYGKYGMDISATGFAVNVDAVCAALIGGGAREKPSSPDVMIYYDSAHSRQAYALAAKIRADGKVAELSTAETRAESAAIAREKGIPLLIAEDGSGERISTGV